MTTDQHPDDTYPAVDPSGSLDEQLYALADWIDQRLNDELADRQYALERANDYVTWLAFRAAQISQQSGIPLIPTDPNEGITSEFGMWHPPTRFPGPAPRTTEDQRTGDHQ